jgi:hypothetical protein
MKERGYINGTVCPVVPTPVGTGVLIAGGNFDSTDHNWIYDNWRCGTMQFWVPAALCDEYDPTLQNDTSHHNHTTHNMMGIARDGAIAHNSSDPWWDDQGNGNCWEDNTYSRGTQTDNFTVQPPSCADGGSVFTPAPRSRTRASSPAASTTATTRTSRTLRGAPGSTTRPGRSPRRVRPTRTPATWSSPR